MTWYFLENTNKTLEPSLYIKDEEFLINTVFLLFLGRPFFAGILAHGVKHVVDAGDFREIVPGWISRTFRDVERLDDSVVDYMGNGISRTKLGARSWVRQFHAQVFNHTEFGSPMNVIFVPAIPRPPTHP